MKRIPGILFLLIGMLTLFNGRAVFGYVQMTVEGTQARIIGVLEIVFGIGMLCPRSEKHDDR